MMSDGDIELGQCWHLVDGSFTEDILDITHYNVFENYIFETIGTPLRGQ